jgi:hypothetical protein
MGRKPPGGSAGKRGGGSGKPMKGGSSSHGAGYKGVSKKKQHSRRAMKAMQVLPPLRAAARVGLVLNYRCRRKNRSWLRTSARRCSCEAQRAARPFARCCSTSTACVVLPPTKPNIGSKLFILFPGARS